MRRIQPVPIIPVHKFGVVWHDDRRHEVRWVEPRALRCWAPEHFFMLEIIALAQRHGFIGAVPG